MFFDSHAHLNSSQFDQDREEVIARARDHYKVSNIINIGFNSETIASSLNLANKYDFIYSSVGWHPNEANSCHDKDLESVFGYANNSKVVAIGEIGLDYYYDNSRDVQATIFRQQIRIARETSLPIIIHSRESHEEVLKILKEERAFEVGGVMHCFSGDTELMNECLRLNFMIGIGGPVTFKKAMSLQKVASMVPIDQLLIETDCPYLAPHPFRGKRNEVGYVSIIAEAIAKIRNIPVEELAYHTTKNAKVLFQL